MTTWLQTSSANYSSDNVKLDLKKMDLKKMDLKLEMWPVNALPLEWCYDTGNDKNITIVR